MLFGIFSLLLTTIVIHQTQSYDWQTERKNLAETIDVYKSYNAGSSVTENEKEYRSGNYLYSRVATFAFNTRNTTTECINRLSELNLSFNNMEIIRICQNKLPAIGEFGAKGKLITIFPILSETDILTGVRVRTTSQLDKPTLLTTLSTANSLGMVLCVVLLSAILGSLLSILAKKYLIELPTTARYDELTGFLRREAFFTAASKVLHLANFTGKPVCVILIDIDHFKKINDTLGHSGGDVALQAIAAQLHHSFRKADIFGRIGGDEFAVVLPETPLDQAWNVAERARNAINAMDTSTLADLKLSVSIGLVEYQSGKEGLLQVINRADEKLYCAKKARNSVYK
ncbi:GGDEF domain-containing protein [Affinibrenneria salicis]|uniref:GGDEF domain-containing protein n=1 Tax=Affinibrenneria salicis TaxID=2590031 RepID=UPI001CC59955|nr:GGDEF domain-containing protein [Affinibrenneria salicis]